MTANGIAGVTRLPFGCVGGALAAGGGCTVSESVDGASAAFGGCGWVTSDVGADAGTGAGAGAGVVIGPLLPSVGAVFSTGSSGVCLGAEIGPAAGGC